VAHLESRSVGAGLAQCRPASEEGSRGVGALGPGRCRPRPCKGRGVLGVKGPAHHGVAGSQICRPRPGRPRFAMYRPGQRLIRPGLAYASPTSYMPAWAQKDQADIVVFQPSLLLTLLLNIPAHIIRHIIYISHVKKGTLVYPGLYPRQFMH
jgi:hypothetical protein